ncbi:5-(carboxyamino)imidazole ribonucleotide mutase [Candidatus Curtissbacteria bacterium RIFCSPHIGHO2_12_41_11]|uniref:N5-carboxyaminoimidazole ribonucleotide mutase n=2 Tax=Candidatus Curtissiibacteriota TaxID=1752717 RepID=A0A1F5H3W0_9BACT|nr:MAG: 5-(carboxyamino)imidazole ribonucleotide mutase [Candidatus Curtissbacteria bacterium RIFCSPHIGHO2_02_FULL_42_15]OGD98778.1 MAG: 5-(carboxyamino)imidazole ribonucleotide mutase [Candidatus Curtissbacteria bacterium RIFCSPHIGHO2_12_41_11]
MKPQVAIIMGSDSDLEVMSESAKVLDELSVSYEIAILSTHRVSEETADFARNAKQKGFKVLIAGAGGAAALPGSIAALTTLPVIGVPIATKSLEGLDSLLSIVQMPPGVPVATVGINAAKNAGLLAAQIIATFDTSVVKNLSEYKSKQKEDVLLKNKKLHQVGWLTYLREKGK